jgi:hypothetical protein
MPENIPLILNVIHEGDALPWDETGEVYGLPVGRSTHPWHLPAARRPDSTMRSGVTSGLRSVAIL